MSIRDAALDLYRDRTSHKAAKDALREFREKEGGCKHEDYDCPPCFRSEGPIGGNDEYEPWCDNCQAAQPLWDSYHKAANLAGASLRKLLLLCRKYESTGRGAANEQ